MTTASRGTAVRQERARGRVPCRARRRPVPRRAPRRGRRRDRPALPVPRRRRHLRHRAPRAGLGRTGGGHAPRRRRAAATPAPTRCTSRTAAPTASRPAGASATSRPTATEFRKPKSLPTQFSAGRRARGGRLRVPRAAAWATCPSASCAAARPMSTSRSASRARSWPRHVGIFATTGMGKSNLMRVLAAGVMRANGRYGLLLVDPHGEYRAALDPPPVGGRAGCAPTRRGRWPTRRPCGSAWPS